jgi:hypothetical protein
MTFHPVDDVADVFGLALSADNQDHETQVAVPPAAA